MLPYTLMLGKNPLQRSLTVYALGGGTMIKWLFFRWLSCNASDSLLASEIIARELMPDLTRGIVESVTYSYVTSTLPIQDTWGGLAVIKCGARQLYILKPCSMRKFL